VTFLILPIRHGGQKLIIELGSLHRANLEDPTGLLNNLLDQFAFVDRQCQRLFAVDIFASSHRLNTDLRVPVIRRCNHHRIDVFAIENLAIVFVSVRFLALGLLDFANVLLENFRVHIG
jgi:hypothetical protein